MTKQLSYTSQKKSDNNQTFILTIKYFEEFEKLHFIKEVKKWVDCLKTNSLYFTHIFPIKLGRR